MESSETPNTDERISLLELQMKELNRQMQKLRERLLGAIPIFSLPLSTSKRLEIAFTALEPLRDDNLIPIVMRYIGEAKNSGLTLDEMVEPLVNVFGFKRAWKLVSHEWIITNYGEWGLAKWRQMGEDVECEEDRT